RRTRAPSRTRRSAARRCAEYRRERRFELRPCRSSPHLTCQAHLAHLPRQLPVLDPVRLIGRGAEAALPVGFVVLVVALEPDHLAVALEREDVRRDAIEEPAV